MAARADPLAVYVLAIVAASAMTVPRPLQAALTPSFAETPEQLTAANGLNSIVERLGVLAGPLAAGLLMAVAGPSIVFLAGGVLCLGSVLLVRRLPGAARHAGTASEAEPSPVAVEQRTPFTDTQLWALDREALLRAITGSEQAVAEAAAHATMTVAQDAAR